MTSPERVDAGAVEPTGDGVQWTLKASTDLNANLVWLAPGHEVGEHLNDAVDVLVVVLAGEGRVEVDGDPIPVAPQTVVHVAKGSRRRIEAGEAGLRYLTVHRRRGPLAVGRRRT